MRLLFYRYVFLGLILSCFQFASSTAALTDPPEYTTNPSVLLYVGNKTQLLAAIVNQDRTGSSLPIYTFPEPLLLFAVNHVGTIIFTCSEHNTQDLYIVRSYQFNSRNGLQEVGQAYLEKDSEFSHITYEMELTPTTSKPIKMVASPDNKYLFIALANNAITVLRVNPKNFALQKSNCFIPAKGVTNMIATPDSQILLLYLSAEHGAHKDTIQAMQYGSHSYEHISLDAQGNKIFFGSIIHNQLEYNHKAPVTLVMATMPPRPDSQGYLVGICSQVTEWTKIAASGKMLASKIRSPYRTCCSTIPTHTHHIETPSTMISCSSSYIVPLSKSLKAYLNK